jgi:hypothetical protein
VVAVEVVLVERERRLVHALAVLAVRVGVIQRKRFKHPSYLLQFRLQLEQVGQVAWRFQPMGLMAMTGLREVQLHLGHTLRQLGVQKELVEALPVRQEEVGLEWVW